MGLWETRVFRKGGEVWTAEVRAESSGAWSGAPPEQDRDTVFFTRIDQPHPPRAATITRGTLNRLSYKNICELVDRGRVPDHRPPAPALRLPTGTEPGFSLLPADEEGLRWAIQPVHGQSRPGPHGTSHQATGIDFVCLDDSALRGHFPFQDSATVHDFLEQHGVDGALTLISEVKRSLTGDEQSHPPVVTRLELD